ncbi:MAG: hypothetical protein ACRD9S_08650 [Pyrinomonadaceae bacterium]
MKRQALKSFSIVSLLLMIIAVSVRAQSDRSKVTNISFNFIVGQKTLPAGAYTVEPNRRDSQTVWLVQSRDGHVKALFITMPLRASATQETGKLVFHKYGDQYFLSEIWATGDKGGRELLMPRLERQLAKTSIEPQAIVLASGCCKN